VFFYETDEVRGINRDSRSAKLGLSNAELLARDMNTLASFVRDNNPAVMPLFWGVSIRTAQYSTEQYMYSLELPAMPRTRGIGLSIANHVRSHHS
jgi:hypothetical protein